HTGCGREALAKNPYLRSDLARRQHDERGERLQSYVHAVEAAFCRTHGRPSVDNPVRVKHGSRERIATAHLSIEIVNHRVSRTCRVQLENGSVAGCSSGGGDAVEKVVAALQKPRRRVGAVGTSREIVQDLVNSCRREPENGSLPDRSTPVRGAVK